MGYHKHSQVVPLNPTAVPEVVSLLQQNHALKHVCYAITDIAKFFFFIPIHRRHYKSFSFIWPGKKCHSMMYAVSKMHQFADSVSHFSFGECWLSHNPIWCHADLLHW